MYRKILHIMRLTTVFIIAAIMQVSASGFAQRLTFKAKEASLQELFKAIKAQTGYNVVVSAEKLDAAKPITVNFKNEPLEKVLDASLEGQNLSYTIDRNTIAIKEAAPSFLDRVASYFASIDVRGRVVDEQGKPMVGATIVVKGKSQVYRSNDKGEFNIPNVADDAVLLISYVGYQRLEINLKDAVMPLEIKLNMATGELEEVNIQYSTGYQDIPKERATGSFVQIDNELFNRTVSTNVLDRILNVTNSLKFEPNSPISSANGTNISIRGFSTISANMKPLIVIDGFPYVEGEGNQREILLNNLNPNDVESITILRDAAAASIWGARAGNGVIVITTKKGKFNQQTKVGFNTSVNIGAKPDLNYLRIISSADAVEYERSVFNTGYYNVYDDLYPSINYFPQLSPVTEALLAHRRGELTDNELEVNLNRHKQHDVFNDLNKYMLQTQVNQQYSFNINGGSDKHNYYASVGYDKNRENAIGNSHNRLTLRIDNTFRPINGLEVNAYIVYTQSKRETVPINYQNFVPNGANLAAPYTFFADAGGNSQHVPIPYGGGLRETYINNPGFQGLLDWHYRPLDEIHYADNMSKQLNARLGGAARYTILPGLSAEIKGQYEKGVTSVNNYKSLKTFETRDLINQFMYLSVNGQLQYPVPLGGILDFSSANVVTWNLRNTLNLNKEFGRHRINAIAGAEARERQYDANSSRKYGYDPNNNTFSSNVDFNTVFTSRPNGSNIRVGSSDQLTNLLDRFVSYFSNVAYTFDDKFTLSGSARIDGSNLFGAKVNQRLSPLWSVGASWEISKQPFYKINWLQQLKLRATYGFNGNMDNRISALPIIRYNPPPASYHTEPFVTLESPPNPGLKWEKSRMINLGMDFSSLNNRISGSIDFYTKKGTDLIGPQVIESTVGVDEYVGNYASTKGKGLDIQLNTVNIMTAIRWTSNILFSHNKDEVTDYNRSSTLSASIITSTYGFPIIGRPLLKVFSYPSAGLDPETGAPRGYINGQITDFNSMLNNNITKPENLMYHGTATPTHFGSFRNTLSYRNLSLSFNLVYKFNYFFRKATIDYGRLLVNWGGHSDYGLRWQKPGDELKTTVPALPVNLDSRYNFYSKSSDLVVKAGHLRLQDVRMDYQIKGKESSWFPFRNVTFFLNANNLGLLWVANNEKLDPDSGENLPIPKSLAFGLQVNL